MVFSKDPSNMLLMIKATELSSEYKSRINEESGKRITQIPILKQKSKEHQEFRLFR